MEQWGSLFSVHDITLLLLRCHGQWTQWTSRKKIQRCKWNTSFCMYYIFTSKTNKGKSLCVSLISIDIEVSRLAVGFQKVFIIRLPQGTNTTLNFASRITHLLAAYSSNSIFTSLCFYNAFIMSAIC